MECRVASPSRTPGHCSGSYVVTERDPGCPVSPVFAGPHDFSLNIIVARAGSELAHSQNSEHFIGARDLHKVNGSFTALHLLTIFTSWLSS